MMNKILKKWPSLLLAALMMLSLVTQVAAATDYYALDNKVRFNVSEGSCTVSGTTIDFSIKSSATSSKTSTIYVYNDGDKAATISFTYTASTSSTTFQLEGTTATSGSYTSKVLQPNGYLTLTLKATNGFLSSKTATLKLEDLTYTEAADSSNVTFVYDSAKGAVTVDGESVANEETVNISSTGAALTATPAANHSFLGWVDVTTNSDGTVNYTVLSREASYTSFIPTADMTVQAVFVKTASDDAWFLVDETGITGKTCMTDDLDVAVTLGAKVILMNNGILSGTHTIPSGVNLLIPCDTANTLCTTEPNVGTGSTKPSAFRTLTLAEGTSITVNGGLSIAGQQSCTMPYNGTPIGPQGVMVMPKNSTITVANGGKLYAWGYVIRTSAASEGSIIAKSGAEVYECFQVRDWRGGSATSDMIDNEQKVLPVSQYYVQSIEVPLTLEKGSAEKVGMSVSATIPFINMEVQAFALAPFIGSDSLFVFDSEDATLIKDYDEETDRTIYDIKGQISLASFTLDLNTGYGINYKLDSSKYVMPLSNNITVICHSESKLTITKPVALLPGTEIYIREGGAITLTPESSCYVYSSSSWVGKGFVGSTSDDLRQLRYVTVNKIPVVRTADDLKDALIQVDGTVNAYGDIYTTYTDDVDGVANICSTGTGKVLTTPLASPKTVTYQYEQKTAATYISVAIKPLWLRNADNTYLDTKAPAGVESIYKYDSERGKWVCETHPKGDYVTVVEAVAPTCTETGKTEGEICSVCGDVLTGLEEVNALGHTEVIDEALASTCTATGLTEGKHCSVCNEVLVAQEVVDALGHTEAIDEAVASTCTETGLTEGKHCSVCETVLVAQEVVAQRYHQWVNGKCQRDNCEAVFHFISTNVAVNEGLDLYFYIEKADVVQPNAGFYVKLTKEHADERGSVTISFDLGKGEWEDYDSTTYRVGYSDIAAKEMTDDVTAVVYYANGTQASHTYTESIKKYAHKVYGQLGSTQPALGPALADMLNYGAACQTLFEYRTDEMANVVEDDGLMSCATTNAPNLVAPTEQGKGSYYYGSTFSAKNKLMFTFYFDFDQDDDGVIDSDVAIDENAYAVISYYDPENLLTPAVESTVPYEKWYFRTETLCGIDVTGIPIAWGRTKIECVVYTGDGAEISSGNVDSIVGYTNRTDDSKVDLLNTMHNLLRFVDSANRYFDSLRGV